MNSQLDPVRRIKAIVLKGLEPAQRRSDVMLLNEYLRRLARLEQESQISVSGPFFDPAELPNVRADHLQRQRRELAAVTGGIDRGIWTTLMENYSIWTDLVRDRHPVALLAPDLFKPLIRMFERGGTFSLHHAWAEFGCGGRPLTHWRQAALREPIEIEEESLSQWDIK